MRVLAVGAHPDDVEIWSGGTLAMYAEEGNEVYMAYVTDGQVGSPTLSPQEISAIRKKEAEEACKVIGARMIWLGFRDEFFFYNKETRLAILNMMRQVDPDVIITHYYPDPSSPDHSNVGQSVNDVALMITIPNIKTEAPTGRKIPPVYLMEPPPGVEFMPDEFVDISKVIGTKRELVSCHKSQDTWLKNQYGISYIEFTETIAKFRGLQCGVKYAEGFKRVKKGLTANVTGTLLPGGIKE